MKKRKKAVAILIFIFLVIGGIWSISMYLPYLEQQQQERLKMQEATVAEYRGISYANKIMGSVNLSRLDKNSLVSTLKREMEPYKNRTLTLGVNKDTIIYTPKDFNQRLYYKCSDGKNFEEGNEDELAKHIISIDKDRPIDEQYDIIEGDEDATDLKVSIQCECNEDGLRKVIQTLSKKYDIPSKNASINSSYKIVAEKEGAVLDTQKIASELRTYLNRQTTKNFSGGYTTTKVTPIWHSQDLKKVNTLIARTTTTFDESAARAYNIKLGASRLDGTFLLPGESISFLDILYDNSDHKSYRKSPAFLKGKIVQARGGGICQISTNAYNTFLHAGIIPEKRYPHSMPIGYATLGLDAALSVGGKDLVIRNTLDAPILILAKTKNGTLAVAIQSYKNALKGYTYKPRAKKISSLEAKGFLDIYKGKSKVKTIALSHDVYQSKPKQ